MLSVGPGPEPRGDVPLNLRLTDTLSRYSITAAIKRSCLGTPKRLKASAFADDPGYFGDNTPYKEDAVSKSTVRGLEYTKWLKPS